MSRRRKPSATPVEKFEEQMSFEADVLTLLEGDDEIVHPYESIDPLPDDEQ